MTISFKDQSGNIFDIKADAIINPVNCVGAMGKGLALEFKKRFPENFDAYRLICRNQELRPGKFFAFETNNSNVKYIINLATKDHWKDESKLIWISEGANSVRMWAESNQIKSLACPAIGSGLGGLPWNSVRDILKSEFSNSKVEFLVFEPRDMGIEPNLESSKDKIIDVEEIDRKPNRVIFRRPK